LPSLSTTKAVEIAIKVQQPAAEEELIQLEHNLLLPIPNLEHRLVILRLRWVLRNGEILYPPKQSHVERVSG
jgi:hypothetical protein